MVPLPPRWDESLGTFSLPFYGRAKVASAKNFQMILKPADSESERNPSSGFSGKEGPFGGGPHAGCAGAQQLQDSSRDIFFMFGKLSKDLFCLDFRQPINAVEAFAMAAAALAKKRVVS